jgi:hypothetical protein
MNSAALSTGPSDGLPLARADNDVNYAAPRVEDKQGETVCTVPWIGAHVSKLSMRSAAPLTGPSNALSRADNG